MNGERHYNSTSATIRSFAVIIASMITSGLTAGCCNDPSGGRYYGHRPGFSPKAESIVFGSNRSGNGDIYVMAADGTQPRRLTDLVEREGWPAYSPDGQHIAFSTENRYSPASCIEIMRSDGSDRRRVTSGQLHDRAPTYSPDGSKLFYWRAHRYRAYSLGGMIWDDWDLYALTSADGTLTRLTHQLFNRSSATSFSPDGKHVVFAAQAESDTSSTLYLLDLTRENSIPHRLQMPTAPQDLKHAWDVDPVFGFDSEQILFVSNRKSRSSPYDYEIWKVRRDGTNPECMTSLQSMCKSPAITPDGTKIIFTSDKDRNGQELQLYTMSYDGSNLKLITSGL